MNNRLEVQKNKGSLPGIWLFDLSLMLGEVL